MVLGYWSFRSYHFLIPSRFYSIVFIALLLISTPVHALFFDVSPEHPYADAIDYLTRQNIVQGYENRSFQPERNINRAEFTKILVSALFPEEYITSCVEAIPADDPVIPALNFPDVAEDAWYTPYICAAWVNGIISGYPDGRFKPEEGVNFVEAAKMLSLGFELTGVALPELGASNVEWYRPYVELIATMNAIPPSIETLGSPINRGELAEMIYRLSGVGPVSSPQTLSKTAEDVTYPVEWLSYTDPDYRFKFAYPNVWPDPTHLARGSYDGRSPYFASEWTVYFGPTDSTNCPVEGTCIRRNMWIDGYRVEDAERIVDALVEDEHFIQIENETTINGLPTVVVLEEVRSCIDKRSFHFGNRWVYVINVQCGGEDQKLYNFFDQMIQSFEERPNREIEHQ